MARHANVRKICIYFFLASICIQHRTHSQSRSIKSGVGKFFCGNIWWNSLHILTASNKSTGLGKKTISVAVPEQIVWHYFSNFLFYCSWQLTSNEGSSQPGGKLTSLTSNEGSSQPGGRHTCLTSNEGSSQPGGRHTCLTSNEGSSQPGGRHTCLTSNEGSS